MGQQRANVSEFEALILMAVMHLGEGAYGVPVRRMVEEKTGRMVSVGALYTTLDRMEEKGFVSSRMGEATEARGGRAKKYFKIEAEGEIALSEFDRQYTSMKQGLNLRPA